MSKKILQIEFTEKAYERLEGIVTRTHKVMPEDVIHTALALYDYVTAHTYAGWELQVKKGGIVKVVLIDAPNNKVTEG